MSALFINKNYPKAIRLRIAMPIIGFILAIMIGLLLLPYVLGFLILFSIGLIACLVLLIGVFILRPSKVNITENGVEFYYIWNKKRFVSWDDFRFLMVNPGDLSTYTGSDSRRGVLCDRKWHYYKVNYEIALEIRKAYIQNMGREPPKDTEGWSNYALP